MTDDRTVNDVRVYRDSAGNFREYPLAQAGGGTGGGTGAPLPEEFKVIQQDETGAFTLDLSKKDDTVEIAIENSQGVLGADIVGLTSSGATVVAESTVGGLWFPLNMARVGLGGQLPMLATEDSSWRSSIVAKTKIRLRVSVAGTGTATVNYSLSTNASLVQLSTAIPPGNNRIGFVGVDGTVTVTFGSAPTVNIGTMPAVAISGTVAANIGNFPANQTVNGVVSITGTPAVTVSGTVAVGTHAVTQSGNWNFTPAPSNAAGNAIIPKTASNAASLIASAVPCNFYGATIVGSPNGAAAYVLALNRTALPTPGSAIAQVEILAVTGFTAGGVANLVPDQLPDRFGTGCVIVCSTSTTTYTPPTTNLPLFIKARVA